MINKIIAILLFTISVMSCEKEKNVEALQKKVFETLKKNQPKISKEKILSVHFGSNITLKWDVAQSRLIEDSEYDSIKNEAQKISILMDNISNAEDLNVKECSKSENLKKGDVAFLFILYFFTHNKELKYPCLHGQYDFIDDGCYYPRGLLYNLEKDRIAAKKRMIACVKGAH